MKLCQYPVSVCLGIVLPPLPPVPCVVALTAVLAADRFPAASLATMEKEYVVLTASPVTVAVVPVTVCTKVVPLYTSYPVTPTLSDAAVQDNETLDAVVSVTVTFVGTVGAWVSPQRQQLLSH